ncbi:hypothetical protein K490DRAFT_74046 [Saccharata proteae CBS 121410]|uniref:Store-operated calcium entry-associated regulatory factor n=1 Tax=Saccharata proteae CBS 121410 TaxID=1314787 RepID=A0A9P4HUN8_9PEZI|nr:hypothetical protein K490DRAFT_74046 [Saccharata proteae CBS 121410]
MLLPPLLLATLLALTTPSAARRPPSDAILLSNVKTLTFRAGHSTTNRRVPAIPQLKCIGGAARGLYDVDVMRCKNAGADYNDQDIQWTCTASLPEEFKLGSTDVVCEGYEGPDDPYVLKGSCGVEYRLALTSKGEEKYGKGRTGNGDGDRESTETDRIVAGAFWFIFIGVVLWMLYKAFIAPNRDAPGAAPRNWGGYGGGGPGDDDDPPPPYPGTDSRYNKPSGGYGTQNPNQAWRPGFWSGAGMGAGAGAAAGYLAGQRNNTRSGGSSWFGGGNAGEGSSRSSSSSASPPSASFSRHESTGFGSTSRR